MNIKKIISFSLFLSLFIVLSCVKNEDFNITDPVQKFHLNEPSAANIFLNFTLPENPAFTLVWDDNITGATSYSIEMANDIDFTNSVILGTTSYKEFTINVEDFNRALADLGVHSYANAAVVFRIVGGEKYSNTVAYTVNAYPEHNPGILNPNNGFSIVLSEDMANELAVTINWEDQDISDLSTVSVNYFVEASKGGTNFANFKVIGSTEALTLDVNHIKLDWVAINCGLSPDVAENLDIRIKSELDSANGIITRYSNPVTITVTAFNPFLDLSTTWGVVGSATPNSWNGPDIPFYKTDDPNIIVAYANLIDGDIKFRENNDWTLNYGDNGNDGTLEEGGSNIPVTAGSYKITFDTVNLLWSMVPYSWGLVGDATPNGWDGPDVAMVYDPYSDTFKGVITMATGTFKFRQNNDWTVNYGDTGADGTLEPGGSNISVTAGNYLVTLDLSDLANPVYSLESTNIWGIVGSAAPNGWDGPDVQFMPGFGWDIGLYFAKNVTLTDGAIKFRQNNDWGVNYGDTGANGTLEPGGADIIVTAGTYNITLNLTDANNPTYTIE